MGGNVSEITSSKYCLYGGDPRACHPWTSVVARGGSWRSSKADEMRVTRREEHELRDRLPTTGFRCAKGNPSTPARVYDTPDQILCECFKKSYKQTSCEDESSAAIGGADPDCLRTYANDCAMMVGCSRGEPGAPPKCLPGFANWGAMRSCGKQCKTFGRTKGMDGLSCWPTPNAFRRGPVVHSS